MFPNAAFSAYSCESPRAVPPAVPLRIAINVRRTTLIVASRITHRASRITHHASRITHHASRIAHRASRIAHRASVILASLTCPVKRKG